MDRRTFLLDASLCTGTMLLPWVQDAMFREDLLMGVRGPINRDALGVTLIHEHIMVDFVGDRYDPDEVIQRVLPFLKQLKEAGCKTFVDCTPAYLGRDAAILKRLAMETGLNILTNTGYYCASNQKYLPQHAYIESAGQLSKRWVHEWKHGIDGTGVKPGFIKTSVDAGPLAPICKKVIEAIALTHLKTGLTISAHTGNGIAAMEELEIIQSVGVHSGAFRWVHAQLEKDLGMQLRAAKMGAWIEFDGINGSDEDSISWHVECLKFMKVNDSLGRTLISHDAGWYSVGEPQGGDFRGYTAIFEKFLPRLRDEGFTSEEIETLLVKNPLASLSIAIRKA